MTIAGAFVCPRITVGHDRCVGHAQTVDSAHAQLGVDDGGGIRSPSAPCRPGGRACASSGAATARRARPASCARRPRAATQPPVGHRAQRVGVDEPLALGEAGEQGRLVDAVGVGEVARVDDRLRGRVGRARAGSCRGCADAAGSRRRVRPSPGSGTSPSPTYGAVAKRISMSGRSAGHPGAVGDLGAHEAVRLGDVRGQHPASRGEVARELADASRRRTACRRLRGGRESGDEVVLQVRADLGAVDDAAGCRARRGARPVRCRDSMSSCGVFTAPPQRMTSRRAIAWRVTPSIST